MKVQEENLYKCLVYIFGIDKRFIGALKRIFNSCFYENTLPLGLTLSPVLSDMYLKKFDEYNFKATRGKRDYI